MSLITAPTVAVAKPKLPAAAYTAGLGHSRDWVDVTNTEVLSRLPEGGVSSQLAALRAAIPTPARARRSLSLPVAQRRPSLSSPMVAMSGHPLRRSVMSQDEENIAEASRARAAGLVVGTRIKSIVSAHGLGQSAVTEIVDNAALRLFDRATELRERKAALIAAAAARGGSVGATYRPTITRLATVMGAAVPYVTMADIKPGVAAEPLLPASASGEGAASPNKSVPGGNAVPGNLNNGAVVVASRFEALYASANAASRRRAALEASLYGPANSNFSFSPAITRRAQSLTPADRAKTLSRTALAGLPATSSTEGSAGAAQAAALAAAGTATAATGGAGASASPTSAIALTSRMHAYAGVYAAKRSARAQELQAAQVPGTPQLNARSLSLAVAPRSASAQGRLAQRLPIHERGLGLSVEGLAARQALIELKDCTFTPAINAPSRPQSRPASRGMATPVTPVGGRLRSGSADAGGNSASRVGPFSAARGASNISSPASTNASRLRAQATADVAAAAAGGMPIPPRVASPSSSVMHLTTGGDAEAAHLRLTRFGVERTARLQAARAAAAAREVSAPFMPAINPPTAAAHAVAGSADSAQPSVRGRSQIARPFTSSTVATATARLYDEAKATEARLEAKRAELLAAREAALPRPPFSPKLSETSKALAEVARARRMGATTPTLLQQQQSGRRPSSASSSRVSPATLPTIDPPQARVISSASIANGSGGVWDSLYTEARVFAAARARAIAAAVADAPSFAPIVNAASAAMVAAKRAAVALQASRPIAPDASNPSDASSVVWDKLLAAAQTEAGLAELAADCAHALQEQALQLEGATSAAVAASPNESLASVARESLLTAFPPSPPSGRVKAAAALIEATSEARRSAAGGVWSSLAAERKDTALLDGIKERLELSQCSFAPNTASPAEKLIAAQGVALQQGGGGGTPKGGGSRRGMPSPSSTANVYSSVVAAVTEEAAAALVSAATRGARE